MKAVPHLFDNKLGALSVCIVLSDWQLYDTKDKHTLLSNLLRFDGLKTFVSVSMT